MVWCVPVYAYESVVCDMYTFYTLVPSMHTFLEGTCMYWGAGGGDKRILFSIVPFSSALIVQLSLEGTTNVDSLIILG